MAQETTIPAALSVPSYVELARLEAKGPFTESTRKLQGICVGALSVFFLGYFNLVAPEGVEIGPLKLKASIVVITITSLVLALYFYTRFITEAHVERRLFKLESMPRIDAAKKDLRENGAKLREWQDQIAAENAVLQKKIEENRIFLPERGARRSPPSKRR
jgi:hypothetical protein